MGSSMTFRRAFWMICALALAGSAGCGERKTETASREHDHGRSMPGTAAREPRTATARLSPTQGSIVQGTVTFTQQGGAVRIVADVNGLTPGEHGFHIHQNGDCSAPDASSAGGHYNPTEMPHGGPHAAQRHAGDLGNLTADDRGAAHFEMTDSLLALDGASGIIGRSVIVHEKVDDYTTQPTGNSGARLACGVIEAIAADTTSAAPDPR